METLTTLFSGLFSRLLGDRLQQRLTSRRKLPWASVAKLSGRLDQIVRLASKDNGEIHATQAFLAETIDGLDLSQLESIRAGAAEASPELVKKICSVLGANYRYAWYGERTPFATDGDEYVPIPEYLSLFRESGLKYIWFVRGNSYPHIGYVALQYNEYKFRVLPDRLHVSSENGNGGASSLSDFARLCENYFKTRTNEAVAWGLEVPGHIAEAVLVGKMHASALFGKGTKRSYWWDDLTDLDHKRPCAKEYAARYDKEFFQAQRLIRWARESKN